MIAGAMRAPSLLLALVLALTAPEPARAQAFFSQTPSPDLRIAPLAIRAAVTPAEGPVRVRLLFSVVAPPDTRVPDLYLLWPGDVKGDPTLGPRDVALAQKVTALGFEVVDEGRLPYRARRIGGAGDPTAREPVPGGAPFVTFADRGELGPSAPATDPHLDAAAHGPGLARGAGSAQRVRREGQACHLPGALGAGRAADLRHDLQRGARPPALPHVSGPS
jgi:hypothetical protein